MPDTMDIVFAVIERRIRESISTYLSGKVAELPAIAVEQPKEASFGEFALPIAFSLARQLRKAPRVIAEEIKSALPHIAGVASIEIAGGGFLNLRLDRGAYGAGLLRGEDVPSVVVPGKVIVEHTNINPNKAAHIGHLRNAVLGDAFVRMLRACGRQVEVQNYIDNTGVQVADVVVGFHYLEHKTPDDVRALIGAARFDYYCWDLYAHTSLYYKTHPEAKQWQRDALHDIESGEGVVSELGSLIADAIVECHLTTMWRLGISYDVLPRESEILQLQFWATAFELLKERGAIYLEQAGKHAGCYVMAGSYFRENAGDEDSKVIVRSNGTVTYVGKDIAYQMWKFGILGKDFYYKPLRAYGDGHVAWVTSIERYDGDAQQFGHGSEVYNVIDSRQSYLQDVVVAGLRALGFPDQAEKSIHFGYEMVALTPRTCVELEIAISEEDKQKPYVLVSGRLGLGVKADDLIDKLIDKSRHEVNSRHAEKPAAERAAVARDIAVGALRYFLLKFTRNTVIAFDLQEALSFEGETGPYVQYAAVRARNIFRKLAERGLTLPEFASVLDEDAMGRQLADENCWQLLVAASKAFKAIESALASGEPAAVAKYAFTLAQSFNAFYRDYPVLSEENAEKRTFLLWMTDYFRMQLERTLAILGIRVPDYM